MRKIIIKPKSEEEYSQVTAMLEQMGIEVTITEPMKPRLKKERPDMTGLFISEKELPPIEPMSLEDFYAMISRALGEVNSGEIITNYELKRYIERWY